ncbi:hypothetical protein ACE193_07360 [Bernardetia sp. OM2101]|uniref:hypothetical protein n=1 Tax=Bernardetia sp. OM2101 TaxID=3344876 RepID=UPI0035D10895
MKIAIMTGLFAEWNMNVYHKKITNYEIISVANYELKITNAVLIKLLFFLSLVGTPTMAKENLVDGKASTTVNLIKKYFFDNNKNNT